MSIFVLVYFSLAVIVLRLLVRDKTWFIHEGGNSPWLGANRYILCMLASFCWPIVLLFYLLKRKRS